MVKFFSTALSVFLYFASMHASPVQTEPVHLPCTPVNFQNKIVDFLTINQLVQVAIGSGLISGGLKQVDPLSIVNKRLEAIPFAVLGSEFTLTPVIKELNVTGLSTLIPRSINVKSPQNLDVGVDFKGNVTLHSRLSFEILQLNKQWWQICWTNILHPKSCPPTIVDAEVAVGMSKPSIGSNLLLSMLQCDPVAAKQGTCKDLTVSDIINAALSKKFDGLLKRILLRFTTASVEDIQVSFDKMTELNFHFPTSGKLLTELGKKIFSCTTSEINEKGDIYNRTISVANKLVKSLGNKVIQEKLQPLFGKNCYDA